MNADPLAALANARHHHLTFRCIVTKQDHTLACSNAAHRTPGFRRYLVRENDVRAGVIIRAAKAGIALAFAGLLSACVPMPGPGEGMEFVCYADGELTEQHVGVASVRHRDGMWFIRYTDGVTPVRYMQAPGESCGREIVTVQLDVD